MESPSDTPDRILPTIIFQEKLSPAQKLQREGGATMTKDYLIKNVRGETVGNFTLYISKPPNKEAKADLQTINIPVQKMGYGSATYVKLIEDLKKQNIRLVSTDALLSRDAVKAWDRLVSENKARLVDKGQVNEAAENKGYSSARYEVL